MHAMAPVAAAEFATSLSLCFRVVVFGVFLLENREHLWELAGDILDLVDLRSGEVCSYSFSCLSWDEETNILLFNA